MVASHADVLTGSATCDEPLRMSAWEAIEMAVSCPSIRRTVREDEHALGCKLRKPVFISRSFLVQYAIILHRYVTKWCENPHFSFSCLLALLLPLNGLQGDIHGLAESNVVSEQLETGQMDTPTVTGAVQDSGAIDTILPSDQQGEVAKEDRCQNAQYRKKRCDKHTQTDQFEPSYVSGMVHGLHGRSL